MSNQFAKLCANVTLFYIIIDITSIKVLYIVLVKVVNILYVPREGFTSSYRRIKLIEI